jgi:tetratricopeptide (TPR) repeat protein
MAVGSSWHIQAYAVNGIGLFRSYNSLMRKPIAAFLTLFVAVMAHADPLVAPPQVIPTEIQSREKVDALIAHAPNHRATVGILHAAMMISIDFGAPAWNSGDHEACSRFYVKTGQSLCDAFSDPNNASAGARKALDELKAALDRVQTSADPDANAWTMRFVFEETGIAASTEIDRASRLLILGQDFFQRSQFPDAAAAFTQASDCLHELDGLPAAEIPLPCRAAPLLLSDALFGEKQYAQAAAAVEDGLHFVPQWPSANQDIRKHFGDIAVYNLLIDDLRATAEKNPDDAALQFLVGYHLHVTGQRDAAKTYFNRVLKLDPNHAAARQFLDADNPAAATTQPADLQTAPPGAI